MENYVRAYNDFDIEAMTANLDDEIIFRNISDGETTLELVGRDAFTKQAEQAAEIFSEREQKIENMIFKNEICEIEIDYRATLVADLPNGSKAGDKIELKGKSVFHFRDDKISKITDVS